MNLSRDTLAGLETVVRQIELESTEPARRPEFQRFVAAVKRLTDIAVHLDPVAQPNVVFDPGNPQVMGRITALALVAQPRVPLGALTPFYGSGIYALYYHGDFPSYEPVSGSEVPLYVGKAEPQAAHARTPVEQGTRLHRRLTDHTRNIALAENLSLDDFTCRYLVTASNWEGAAESHLIDAFRPVWNHETRICYGFGKHGDSSRTRTNTRSPWDTLHPGRPWATTKSQRSPEEIHAEIVAHYHAMKIFRSEAEVIQWFVESLSQVADTDIPD